MGDSKAKPSRDDLGRRLKEAEQGRDGKALAALAALDLPKESRKELRRIAHRLRSQGVAVELPGAPPRPAAAAAPEAASIRAFLSVVDGAGGRLLWLVSDPGHGGREVFSLYFDDEQGLRNIDAFQVSRKKGRLLEKDLVGNAPVPVAAVDLALAHALLAEAEERTRQVGAALPDGYGKLHARAAGLPAAAALDPHPARLLAGEPGPRELIELSRASAAFLTEPPLDAWGPSQAQARELAARIEGVESSTVIVGKVQQAEQLARIFEQEAERQLAGEGRGRWARRCFDTAWVLSLRGEAEMATRLARLALAIEILSEEQPAFLAALLRRPFDAYLRQKLQASEDKAQTPAGGGKSEAKPVPGKLIVPP